MGLLNIFDKKICSICGNEIKFLGNRKLADGNMCKNCESKLSPLFSERRQSTVQDILDQLEYREANKKEVEAFNPTRTFGQSKKIYIDDDARKFIVTSQSKWRETNPDVISFKQVTGCDVLVDERKEEVKTKDKDGKTISYTPPRYKYKYDIYDIIHVNSPYFDEIKIKINANEIERQNSAEFEEARFQADIIKEVLTQVVVEELEARLPKTAVVCPFCGATTVPDERGCCEYCGGSLAGVI